MPPHPAKKTRIVFTLAVFILLASVTLFTIKLAKGYRPNLRDGQLNGMGLLTATSYPKTAKVYLNGKLNTATDTTIYLSPATYDIRIVKDSFTPWTKSIPISSELVSPADARLFPLLPAINPLTYTGITNPSLSPDNNSVAYTVNNSNNTEDNGLYVFSINGFSNNLLGSSQITQITNLNTYDYNKAHLFWSPDGNQILAVFTDPKTNAISSSHLLNSRSFNKNKDLADSTYKLTSIITNWREQLSLNNSNLFKLLPDYMKEIISTKSQNAYFSPDQEKIFFTSTIPTILPDNPQKTLLPNINSTKETRQLKKGYIYVFDIKEGTNYEIEETTQNEKYTKNFILPTPQETNVTATASSKTKISPKVTENLIDSLYALATQTNPLLTGNLIWYSTSRHLIISTPTNVNVVEYDGLNKTTLFQTNINSAFAVPSSDGHRLIILSNLNQSNSPLNLFSIDLK